MVVAVSCRIYLFHDTSGITTYFTSIVNSGTLYLYALEYSDQNREKLSSFTTYQDLYKYLQSQPLLYDFTNFAATKGIKKRPNLINISGKLIESQLQAYIVRNFFDEAGFYPIFLKDDPTLLRAIQIINEGKSVPTLEKKDADKGIAGIQATPPKIHSLAKEIVQEDYIA